MIEVTTNREKIPTSGGVPVTDELIHQLASEAESGFDVTALRRRGGRRPVGSGPGEVFPVRLDSDLRTALAQRAAQDHVSASEVVRQALTSWLQAA